MAKTGTLLKTDGTRELVTAKGKSFTLNELYAAVGTDIVERLRVGKHTFWFCEEGKLRGKPANYAATFLAHVKQSLYLGDIIVGNVLVTPPLAEDTFAEGA